jgi:hypothetical protein
VFVEVSDEARAQLDRSAVTTAVGKDAFYASVTAMLTAYRQSTATAPARV